MKNYQSIFYLSIYDLEDNNIQYIINSDIKYTSNQAFKSGLNKVYEAFYKGLLNNVKSISVYYYIYKINKNKYIIYQDGLLDDYLNIMEVNNNGEKNKQKRKI
ncbi:MAG: hypothetical protein QXV17_14890 [Candidatus Micrarchaeaceae archaeon]